MSVPPPRRQIPRTYASYVPHPPVAAHTARAFPPPQYLSHAYPPPHALTGAHLGLRDDDEDDNEGYGRRSLLPMPLPAVRSFRPPPMLPRGRTSAGFPQPVYARPY